LPARRAGQIMPRSGKLTATIISSGAGPSRNSLEPALVDGEISLDPLGLLPTLVGVEAVDNAPVFQNNDSVG